MQADKITMSKNIMSKNIIDKQEILIYIAWVFGANVEEIGSEK